MNLKITYTKSGINAVKKVKAALETLGLRKLNQTVVRPKSPAVEGQIAVIQHLVTVTEVE